MSAEEPEIIHSPEENAPLNENSSRYAEGRVDYDDDLLNELARASKSRRNDKIGDSVWKSTLNIIYDSIPSAVYTAAIYIVRAIDLSFVTRAEGTVAAAGIGIGATWVTLVVLMFIVSLNHGTTTLVSQAFGAHNFDTAGLCLHRALIVRLPIMIIQFMLLMFSKIILINFNIQEEVAQEAAIYCWYATFSLIPFVLLDTFKSFLFGHQIFFPIVIVMTMGITIHWGMCYYFVIVLGLGVKGAGLAYFVNVTSCVILLFLYFAIWKPTKNTLFWLKKESTHKLLPQLGNEIVIGGMNYLESLVWESMALLIGSYSSAQINAHSMSYSIASLSYMPLVGVGTTITVYTSYFIGEKDIPLIQKSVRYAIVIPLVTSTITIITFALLKDEIFSLYTTDAEVIEIATKISWLYIAFGPLEHMKGLLAAILKAIGREKQEMVAYLVSYYLVGFPVEYVLGTLGKWYDLGVWIGLIVGSVTLYTLIVVILIFTDYNKQIKVIEKRVKYLD